MKTPLEYTIFYLGPNANIFAYWLHRRIWWENCVIVAGKDSAGGDSILFSGLNHNWLDTGWAIEEPEFDSDRVKRPFFTAPISFP
jgi:hypothetical protein